MLYSSWTGCPCYKPEQWVVLIVVCRLAVDCRRIRCSRSWLRMRVLPCTGLGDCRRDALWTGIVSVSSSMAGDEEWEENVLSGFLCGAPFEETTL